MWRVEIFGRQLVSNYQVERPGVASNKKLLPHAHQISKAFSPPAARNTSLRHHVHLPIRKPCFFFFVLHQRQPFPQLVHPQVTNPTALTHRWSTAAATAGPLCRSGAAGTEEHSSRTSDAGQRSDITPPTTPSVVSICPLHDSSPFLPKKKKPPHSRG